MLSVRRIPHVTLRASALALVATVTALTGCGKKADAPAEPAGKPLVAMIRAADWMGSEWSEDAIKFGLAEAGLEEGRDYELQISSAQGDIATLPNLIDQARDAKAKVIVTLQDATLQVALERVKDAPVVFHLLSDPFAMGAGTSDSTHLANVTGVYAPGFGDPEQERRVALIQRTLPKARTIGILFSTDEALAVSLKDKMTTAADRAGLKVQVQGIAGFGEVGQAAQALVAKKVDAIEIYGNAAHTGFMSIMQVTQPAKVPVFSSSPFEVTQGAIAAFYPDFQEGGVEAGKMVARILKGESPAAIPFHQVVTVKLSVNPNTGVAVPGGVTSEANQVVGDTTKK